MKREGKIEQYMHPDNRPGKQKMDKYINREQPEGSGQRAKDMAEANSVYSGDRFAEFRKGPVPEKGRYLPKKGDCYE